MTPIGDGTGFTEFEFMDWDYKGKVSFKAYCKWVKKAQVGEAYRSKGIDSSFSSSDEYDAKSRDFWKKIDTKHTGKMPTERVMKIMT